MIEEIKKVYYEINNDFIQKTPFNTQQVRHETIQKILLHLESVFTDDYVFRVLCDETNNTPEIIDNNQLIARVEWRLRKRSEEA